MFCDRFPVLNFLFMLFKECTAKNTIKHNCKLYNHIQHNILSESAIYSGILFERFLFTGNSLKYNTNSMKITTHSVKTFYLWEAKRYNEQRFSMQPLQATIERLFMRMPAACFLQTPIYRQL